MPSVKKTAAPKAPTATPHPVATGGATVSGPKASTATPHTVASVDTSGFGYLGWFTVDAEGCTVRFGIEQQQYVLAATLPNYNALFSMLLACWLDRHKVNITYRLPLLTAQLGASDGPLSIVSITTI